MCSLVYELYCTKYIIFFVVTCWKYPWIESDHLYLITKFTVIIEFYITPCRNFHSLHSFWITLAAFLNWMKSCRFSFVCLNPLYLRWIFVALVCIFLTLRRTMNPRITACRRMKPLFILMKRVLARNLRTYFWKTRNSCVGNLDNHGN